MKKRIRIGAGLTAALVFCYFAINAVNQQLLTDTFNRIYTEGTWGKDVAGKGTSGSGSTLEITGEYRAYVEDFIKKHAVKSVVDAGCGDWSFSSAMDWGDARAHDSTEVGLLHSIFASSLPRPMLFSFTSSIPSRSDSLLGISRVIVTTFITVAAWISTIATARLVRVGGD